MQRWQLVALGLAALLAGCASSSELAQQHAATEPWAFEFDGRDWKLGHANAGPLQAIREYVLPGETVESYTELVTSQYLGMDMPPHEFYEKMRRTLSVSCPSLEISVVEESARSILFEWRHDACQGYKAQHELHRYVNGHVDSFALAYVEMTKQLTPQKREQWLSILRSAALRPGL